MDLHVHFVVSLALFSVLSFYFGFWALLVFVGGFLIDGDHHLYYIITSKDLSLRRCYKYHKTRSTGTVLDIFHTAEFLAIYTAFSLFIGYFFLIFIGVLSHILLDCISVYTEKTNGIIYTKKSVSIYHWLYCRN